METSKEHAGKVIASLVEKYEEVLRRGEENDLLEENVKIKFINPLLINE